MSSITGGKYFLLAISSTQINKDFSRTEIELKVKNAEPALIDASTETELQCDMLLLIQHIDIQLLPHSSKTGFKMSNNT